MDEPRDSNHGDTGRRCIRCIRWSKRALEAERKVAELEAHAKVCKAERDSVVALRNLLRQEYDRPAYAEVGSKCPDPIEFAIDMLHVLKEARDDYKNHFEAVDKQRVELLAQLDRANARIDEQDISITELCDQSEDDAAGLVIMECKLDRATKPRPMGSAPRDVEFWALMPLRHDPESDDANGPGFKDADGMGWWANDRGEFSMFAGWLPATSTPPACVHEWCFDSGGAICKVCGYEPKPGSEGKPRPMDEAPRVFRPMSEAPRDGTEVELYRSPVIVSFHSVSQCWEDDSGHFSIEYEVCESWALPLPATSTEEVSDG